MQRITIPCPLCGTNEITVTVREADGQSYFKDGNCHECGLISGALMMKPSPGGVARIEPVAGSYGVGERLEGI